MSNQREVLSKNLRRLINSKGVDQKILADYLGISEMSVSNWVNGVKYPRMGNVQKMADYFGVMKSDLIEDRDDVVHLPTSSQYPIYPPISAGLPNEVDGVTENDVEIISIPDVVMGKWAGGGDIYITRTNGESMNRIIPHDSLIAVKPIELHELKDNDIVVYRNHGEYAVKRFEKHDDKLVFRPDSTDTSFTDDVVYKENADDLRIKGKVVLWIVTAD